MPRLITCIACELAISCGFIFKEIKKSHLKSFFITDLRNKCQWEKYNNASAIQLHKIHCNNQKIILSSS